MMSRAEANKVVVGDIVENMFGVKYKVTDLQFTHDSDNNNAILATLKNKGKVVKCNLETCTLVKEG